MHTYETWHQGKDESKNQKTRVACPSQQAINRRACVQTSIQEELVSPIVGTRATGGGLVSVGDHIFVIIIIIVDIAVFKCLVLNMYLCYVVIRSMIYFLCDICSGTTGVIMGSHNCSCVHCLLVVLLCKWFHAWTLSVVCLNLLIWILPLFYTCSDL